MFVLVLALDGEDSALVRVKLQQVLAVVILQDGVQVPALVPHEEELDVEESEHDHDEEDDDPSEGDNDQQANLLVGEVLKMINIIINSDISFFTLIFNIPFNSNFQLCLLQKALKKG